MTPSPKNSLVSAEAPLGEELGQGRYVVTGSLGAGSQGETLEAVDKREGRPVAIKRFTLRSAKSWKDVELAEREASVLASLNHPSLPRYVEHFEEDGALYLVMEKVEGESLAARRRRKQPLTHEQVLRFLRDVAASLAYLHGHAPPIVHRDIKPGNVILRPDGSYCLVDFGSVRDSLKPEGGSTVVGTFGFMAPEQFQGRAAPVSDVYAVGATALCLISGQEPENLPHKGLAIDVDAALRGQVDRRLIAALLRMLEPDPDRRAASVALALQLSGLATDPVPAGSSMAEAAKRARRARLEAESPRQTDEHASRYSGRAERYRERDQRRADREQRRRVEREARKQRQAERRETRRARHYAGGQWHPPGRPVPPGIVLGIVILVALQVARLATFALFQVLLPILFMFVPDRRRRMLAIGQLGQSRLHTASEHIRYQFMGGPTPAGFVLPSQPSPRTRISVETEAEELAAETQAATQAEELAAEAQAEELETQAEALGAQAEERAAQVRANATTARRR
jgi:Protein kinase domain